MDPRPRRIRGTRRVWSGNNPLPRLLPSTLSASRWSLSRPTTIQAANRRWILADSDTTLAVHEPGLRHHFDDSAQQLHSSTLGMWVFLITEIMFFGGMFGAYTVYR